MKKLFLDNFWLKIIACIAMTIAHIGNFLKMFGYITYESTTFFVLEIIGKIAFPIFIFLLIEGVNHTKSIKKYLGRLLGCAAIAYVVILVMNLPVFAEKFATGGISTLGNIFLDLFLLALSYYLMKQPEKYKKALSALPLLFIAAMSILKYCDATKVFAHNEYHFLYDGLYTQYDFVGILIFYGIIIAYKINDKVIHKALHDDELEKIYLASPDYQFRKNVAASISIVLVSVVCYLISIIPDPHMVYYCDFAITSYVALAGLFVLFYNGKLGFKNKYIQGAFYLYYPLHLAIIFLIFYLI